MLVNLSRGVSQCGLDVDFLMGRAEGPHLSSLPSVVRIIELGHRSEKKILPKLVQYLRKEQPRALLSSKSRSNQDAIEARSLAGVPTRVVIRVGTTVSRRVKGRNPIKRWKSFSPMRRFYPQADAIVAVSGGVARDVAGITGIPLKRIRVIPNPVITPELPFLAEEPVAHPWFTKNGPPIILGGGGFRRQKDFSTLIRAFALIRKKRAARLVILGKGRQKRRLERLALKLGIGEDFYLPGFVANPFAYMAKSSLFVLSSRWEGSPNALTEALALGIPVVSTDCESGPAEILKGGHYGPLVPVEDIGAMARAIEKTLENPLDPSVLKAAVQDYAIETSTAQYMDVLGLKDEQ